MRLLTSARNSRYLPSLSSSLFYRFGSEETQSSALYNPYSKKLISKRDYIKEDELFTKLSMAFVSYRKWREVKLDQRVDLVKQFVKSIIKDKQYLKPIISSQIGKSYQDIDEQFRRIAYFSDHFIESGRKSLKSQIIEQQAHKLKKVSYEPVGLALLFPYFSEPIFDSLINLIPCLISGNGAIIKSSDFNHFLGPYLQKRSKQIFGRSALVADVFIQPNQLPALAQFRSIKKVLYSGTPQSAKHIFQTLVRDRFIDCNLFFGGQDAAYIDQTADLHHAAREIVQNSFYNNGQSYDCTKRIYIDSIIQSRFIEILRKEIQKIVCGNPTESSVNLGPLCVPENASIAEKYINDAISQGASCQIGGLTSSDGQSEGVFFEPTLLSNCTNDMMIVQTQINAPILCAISLSKQSIAQQINESQYGTGLRIFTQDIPRYDSIIGDLQLGRISFNSGSLFDKNLPIQGWKKSGKGKILSELSFQEFSIPKSYNIKEL